MADGIRSKFCRRCGETKPLDEFGKDARRPDGRHSRCKACKREQMRAHRAADPARAREIARAFRRRHPERIKQEKRAYRQANRDRLAAKDRAYREANRDRIAEYQREYWAARRAEKADYLREWRKANPDKWADYAGRRRAAIRATTVGPIDLGALWTGLCGICGLEMDPALKRPDPGSRSLDHIVPLAAGGTHTQGNLQYAHLICNLIKGTRMPE